MLGTPTAVVHVKPVAVATKIRQAQGKLGRVRDGLLVMVLVGLCSCLKDEPTTFIFLPIPFDR